MEQPVRLGVALDRHGRDHPVGARLDEDDAHPFDQGALPHAVDQVEDLSWRHGHDRRQQAAEPCQDSALGSIR